MTSAGTPAPWSRTSLDPDAVLREVRRLLPGVTAWLGEYTGSYWALLGGELREFKDPQALLTCLRTRLLPPPRPGRVETVPQREVEQRTQSFLGSSEMSPTLFDRPRGRWRRFLAGIRHFLLGEEDFAW